MPVGFQPLEALVLARVIQQLQDTRLMPGDLRFLGRTPLVPAVDDEIMARFTGYVTIADIIADDQKAVVYSTDKISYEGTNIPNLKHGRALNQSMLNQLDSIARNNPQADMTLFRNYRNRVLDGLLLGVRQRMEALLVAMALDGLSYDRLGIIMSNVTWGMPSDLKATPNTSWDTANTATPVDDILAVALIGSTRYGQTFNRVTMSTPAFRYMIATTEFQSKARAYLAPNVSYTNLAIANLEQQRALAQNVLGMQIELYDSRYWTQNENGTLTSAPFLPITKVILSNTADDNDPMAMDFANGIVTESIVADLVGSNIIGSLGGPQRGPVAYATPTSTDLNPPGVTMWGVARGFPRKHKLQATAVLTVGSFSDQIDPTATF